MPMREAIRSGRRENYYATDNSFIDHYAKEMQHVDSWDWRVFGDDAAGRDRRHWAIRRQRSVVQLRGTGAAGAGVGGESGVRRHHPARFVVDALDYGGSGAGGIAQFSGGQAIL